MIPAFLITRFGPKIAAALFWATVALLAILLSIGTYFGVKHFFTAGLTEQVKVGGAQLQASGDSGHDAVQTLGNVMSNEATTDELTTENANVIDHAEGSHDPVAPAARAAGMLSLCTHPSYRLSHPACMPSPAP